MSYQKNTYILSKVKQLIDLNGDSINFDISFTVNCQDDTPFKLLVVDQTTLDNSEELEYKEQTNTISGNIIADKNVYQNYFLILKAEKECKVDVEITKKELPITPTAENETIENKQLQQQENSIDWKKIMLIAVSVCILLLLWYLYNKKSSQNNIKIDSHSVSNPPQVPSLDIGYDVKKSSRPISMFDSSSNKSVNVSSDSSSSESNIKSSILRRIHKTKV
jgi:hypothetical protein